MWPGPSTGRATIRSSRPRRPWAYTRPARTSSVSRNRSSRPSTCRSPGSVSLSRRRVYARRRGSGMEANDYAHRRLVNALGPERVARGELERMVYSHDFASLPKPALLQWQLYPDFVVLPQTTEEVSTIVRLSDETGLPITPRGAGTGAYGGAVPNRGGVLVDMRKMNKIAALDPTNRTVTVEAGVPWQFLAE